MRRWIAVVFMLALAGCGGSAGGPRLAPGGHAVPGGPSQPLPSAGGLKLALQATADGGAYRVTLVAPDAVDLYQIAGALTYDPGRYTLLGVEAGGGLGGPEACLFVGSETAPGRIPFAYTIRRYGPGASGRLNLLSLRFTPREGFSLADFTLVTAAGKLRVRDSHKRDFAVSLEVAP